VTVADAFDAMTTDRSYRPALSPAQARMELESSVGSRFDPDVVRAFTEEFPEPELLVVGR
jgi:HD-GYP domain-containing protein (c-di-GMP phosphodiesterase class II)